MKGPCSILGMAGEKKKGRKKMAYHLTTSLLNCKGSGLSGAEKHRKLLWTAPHLLAVLTDTSFSEVHGALLFPNVSMGDF